MSGLCVLAVVSQKGRGFLKQDDALNGREIVQLLSHLKLWTGKWQLQYHALLTRSSQKAKWTV